jgi:glycerophosphoryl diester phosphodiesterase
MERTLADIQGDQQVESPPAAAAPVKSEPGPKPPGSPAISRRILLSIGGVVAVVAVVVAIILSAGDPNEPTNGATKKPTTSTATKPPKLGGPGAPIVLAHRGGDEEFAWQTIPAFEHAAKIGAEIETDVRWTKDGVPILVHDANTTPGMECKSGNHVVKDTNWPVLRDECRSPAAASNGKQYKIPMFDQAMSALAKIPGAEVYPEVKVQQGARQVRQFVTIIQSVRMTKHTVVTSTMGEELAKIHAQAQKLGVDDLRLMQFVSGKRVPVANLADDLWGVAVEVDVATEAYVKELKGKRLKVMIWIVNTPKQWELADRLGADLVMTDKPTAFGQWSKDH